MLQIHIVAMTGNAGMTISEINRSTEEGEGGNGDPGITSRGMVNQLQKKHDVVNDTRGRNNIPLLRRTLTMLLEE
jgi:hypothetical protein